MAKRDPVTWRVYARPILRGLFQGLSFISPEVAIAHMLMEGGRGVIPARKIEGVLAAGPESPDGRRVLHEIETELQQLNHEDAQQVLEMLMAKKETGGVSTI